MFFMFNTCTNLSIGEIEKSLKDVGSSVILILLYRDSDNDNNKLVRDMLLNETQKVNAATGITKVFTFIDKKWEDLIIPGEGYGCNKEVFTHEKAYNMMLFIGSSFGVGYKYPAIIAYRKSTNEHIVFSLKKYDFKNDYKNVSDLICDFARLSCSAHGVNGPLALSKVYECYKGLIISSNTIFEDLNFFDYIDDYDKPQNMIKEIVDDSGMTQNDIERDAGITKTYISSWIKGSRKPKSQEIKDFCRVTGANYDQTNLLLTSYDYAPLSYSRDRELIEYMRKNCVRKISE